ncbi:Reverse transcriptase (RNA-dependent DNA polymerase) [Xanthomonas vesicatoria ATCC 35937]|uniref:RNA-directed DNA polymerase n=1 Tax=Xanthomonas vesicatoria ATCC 35937 TaxID=925775 RepID=F0B8A1_9XANT|nr:retron Ec67 family RNA-directed DNA polymerase/endonuclease [Xanthomonas vesicatoria]APP73927.1 Reverse transcriptase (RNA-dependent DNA polymerase) [Xanthomonas vesicatoria ATCC 35937]EGD11350.1 Reverse transcriptase (RNA-dependent DNA polymerase) [Xanthomonas vesicatoria ATCC 35937]KTF34968.1 Reverse transcriptase (RNA-dependent DNA polymerase) [Xanthomonas vesicatoria]MCC8597073.1 retron Ec67 family RNA-directed DNA polymerase/endonuclease [Xanthomonas vesicatoria]MCC8605421.1 retron Ec6
MSKLFALQQCSGASDVAHLIGFQPKALGYVAWGTKARYSAFDIAKRSGGKRTIHAPIPQLKLAQQNLAELLQECELEIEAALGVKKRLSHGFRRDHSILTNADIHCGKRYVLNFDLEDFFGTINFGRVRGYFTNNKHFRLKPDVATLIAQLACHESKLPQGAPTSPVITNLIGNILDMRLVKIARANGCAYSRYADDITFSTSAPEFPTAVASEIAPHAWTLSKTVEDSVKASRFSINASKTRMLYRRSRQDVTGIIVNKFVNVNSDYQKRLRVMVHHLRSSGIFHRKNSVLGASGNTSVQKEVGTRNQLQGMIGFALQVEAFRRYGAPPPPELTSTERLYKRFLFYTQFAAHDKPVLLFEGKTDVVYLKSAIKSLSASYPTLYTGSDILVHLLRHTPRMERLFGLSGGGHPLIAFIKNYHEEYRHITGPRGAKPVIIVVDNDQIGRNTINLIEKITKTVVAPGTQAVKVFDNLHVILTSPHDKDSELHCIEDCFDPAFIKAELDAKTIYNGKKIKKNNEFDPSIHISKSAFAETIVKAKAAAIDFAGFKPLLDHIAAVIAKY